MWSPAGHASEAATKPRPLQCETGPINRVYGTTAWVVYSCDDSRTVVVVAAAGSPAAPFYFMFAPTSEGYRLVGEGNGNREATNAAYEELKKLSKDDVQAIIAATKRR
jgi:hypothetical protein